MDSPPPSKPDHFTKIKTKEEFLQSSLLQWFNLTKPQKSINLPSKFDSQLVDIIDGCYINETIQQLLPSKQYETLDKDARYGTVEQLSRNLHSCIVNLRRFFRKKKIILTECSIDVIAIATYAASTKSLVTPTSSVENSPRNTVNSKNLSDNSKHTSQLGSTSLKSSSTTSSLRPESVFEHLERLLWLFAFAIYNSENTTTDIFRSAITQITNLDAEHQAKFMEHYLAEDGFSVFAVVIEKANPPIPDSLISHLNKVCDQRNQQYDEQFHYLLKSYSESSENTNFNPTTPNGSPIKQAESIESLSVNSTKNYHKIESDQLRRKLKNEQEKVETIQFDLDEVQSNYKNLQNDMRKQRQENLNLQEYKHSNVNLIEEISELRDKTTELSKVYEENRDMMKRTKDLEYYQDKFMKNQDEIDDLKNERTQQEEIYSNLKLRLDNMVSLEEDFERAKNEKIVMESRNHELDLYVEQMKEMIHSLETQ